MLRFRMFCVVFGVVMYAATSHAQNNKPDNKPAAKPALTVKLVAPSMQLMPRTLSANGSIAPWAEALVSAEIGGLRIAQVLAQVGDSVKKGQILVKFSTETARIELELAKAQVAEAEAAATDAVANAQRARAIEREGFYSHAQLTQIFSLEKAATAKVRAAKIKQMSAELSLKETDVIAPDDGIVSAKSAILGAVVPQGAELFRLIRQGRLEWRAELTSSEIVLVKSGMSVQLTGLGKERAQGTVRMTSPTIDPASRTAIAYVDIMPGQALRAGLRAGAYARGEFALGAAVASLSVPQTAIVLRDGFSYVFVLREGGKVAQVKVQTGARAHVNGMDWLAIEQGLKPDAKVVASGAVFLADGDSVKVSQP